VTGLPHPHAEAADGQPAAALPDLESGFDVDQVPQRAGIAPVDGLLDELVEVE
jgi:hypothetical protein